MGMEYEKTHPWLTFRLPKSLFMELGYWLGEAVSKTEHLSHTPLLPELALTLNRIYLEKGVIASTAIEGNSIGEELAREIIEGRKHAPESQKYMEQEIENVLKASNGILARIEEEEDLPDLTIEQIKEFNRIVLEKLPGRKAEGGVIRGYSVLVGNVYRGAPCEECEFLLKRLTGWLASGDFVVAEELRLACGFIKAIVAHIYFVWIHPFGDGNGRTARLIELYLLLQAGFPAPSAHLLSDYYNKTREEYYEELRRLSSDKSRGYDLTPFIRYALRGYLDGIRGQIELVEQEQCDILWKQYTHNLFDKKPRTKATERQKKLALFINDFDEPQEVTYENLPPVLYLSYRGLTARCLSRDINQLILMNLVKRTEAGCLFARKELITHLKPISINHLG